jgi:hypothetical protein
MVAKTVDEVEAELLDRGWETSPVMRAALETVVPKDADIWAIGTVENIVRIFVLVDDTVYEVLERRIVQEPSAGLASYTSECEVSLQPITQEAKFQCSLTQTESPEGTVTHLQWSFKISYGDEINLSIDRSQRDSQFSTSQFAKHLAATIVRAHGLGGGA